MEGRNACLSFVLGRQRLVHPPLERRGADPARFFVALRRTSQHLQRSSLRPLARTSRCGRYCSSSGDGTCQPWPKRCAATTRIRNHIARASRMTPLRNVRTAHPCRGGSLGACPGPPHLERRAMLALVRRRGASRRHDGASRTDPGTKVSAEVLRFLVVAILPGLARIK